MKKMIGLLLVGMCFNTGWAQESMQEDTLAIETPIQNAIEPLESHTSKFAELAKTTMDLMSPEVENPQKRRVEN